MTEPIPQPAGPGDRPPPPRFAYDSHTWKEMAHLLTNLPVSIVGFVYAVTALSVGAGLTVTVIGLPLLALGLMGARQLGRLERARARAMLGVRVDEPSPLPWRRSGGFWPGLWQAVKDPVGWRTFLFMLIRLPWGILTFTVTLTGLFVLWPVLAFVVRAMADVDRAMVRGLLAVGRAGAAHSRAGVGPGVVVDTAAADLRRIERDLHDGAQARLVNLAMGLGLAKEKLLEDPDAAASMVEEAHGEVKLALQELRDLARGIHPAVLTDRGLDAALSSVAARCTVPVTVTVDLEERALRPRSRASRTSRSPSCSRTSASTAGRIRRRWRCGGRTTGCSSRCGTTARAGRASTAARACGVWPSGWARWTGCSSWTPGGRSDDGDGRAAVARPLRHPGREGAGQRAPARGRR